ncbi:MAG: hypothetical protein QM492_09350 [Rhodobacterales bacterium]
MLLTGFDSKYLNTLYVDKNLKYHGLIQAFSRTNRVLNDSKPWGNILDFRNQQDAVDKAIALFSGEHVDNPKQVWLVDPAPKVIDQYAQAVQQLDDFMQTQGLEPKPEQVANLKGDKARAEFINRFKEVQRLKTRLDQYTDLDDDQRDKITQTIPDDTLRGFKSTYLDVAKDLKAKQGKTDDPNDPVEQLDFEFVLFASADIDYDYIMGLIARYTGATPEKQQMTRDQLINLIASDAQFMGNRDDITAYISNLEVGVALDETEIRQGFEDFKAAKHRLALETLQLFTNHIIDRMIFDGEDLGDLLAPLDLGWKARRQKELALMDDLTPHLHKRAGGQEISGLEAYEQ